MAVNMKNQEGIQVHNLEAGREQQLPSGPHGHGLSSSILLCMLLMHRTVQYLEILTGIQISLYH